MTIRLDLLAAAMTLAASVAAAQDAPPTRIVLPVPDAEQGRLLFTSKGCVVCHSINGVGGKAGPALDAGTDEDAIDPLGFAARMWRGAGAMTILQSMEFGYEIELSGEDIADLAAFVASPELQSGFSESDVPELIRGWTIDEPFPPEGGEWPDGQSDEAPAGEAGGDAVRGRLLAGRWCASCHVVAPGQKGGATGPAFADIAARPDLTEEHIREWLSVPHQKMPEFLNLTEADFADLAAHIGSLAP